MALDPALWGATQSAAGADLWAPERRQEAGHGNGLLPHRIIDEDDVTMVLVDMLVSFG